jgi:RNA polymerase sigma factor (sigma-70 family)
MSSCDRFPECNCPQFFEKSRAGDDRAFSDLVCNLTPLVKAVARSTINKIQSDDLNEITQIVFIKVHTTSSPWDNVGPFCHWVGRIARRVAIDFGQDRERRERIVVTTDKAIEAVDLGTQHDPPYDLECISRVIEGLTGELRIVFTCRVDERMTDKEIAKMLGCTERTVQNRLKEIRVMIKKCYDQI